MGYFKRVIDPENFHEVTLVHIVMRIPPAWRLGPRNLSNARRARLEASLHYLPHPEIPWLPKMHNDYIPILYEPDIIFRLSGRIKSDIISCKGSNCLMYAKFLTSPNKDWFFRLIDRFSIGWNFHLFTVGPSLIYP